MFMARETRIGQSRCGGTLSCASDTRKKVVAATLFGGSDVGVHATTAN